MFQWIWSIIKEMKKLLLKIFLFVAILVPASVFAATPTAESFYEQIKSFDTEINLKADASADITEKILYDFGTLEKHGVYRDIPYKYTLDTGGQRFIQISNVLVTDDAGTPYKFSQSREGAYVRLKIGDPEKYVTGQKSYLIKYNAKGIIRYFDDHDEFYWNVPGDKWTIDINYSSAVVNFPKSFNAEDVKVTCFYGYFKSDQKCDAEKSVGTNTELNSAQFGQKNILIGQNFTVVVGLPKGTFERIEVTEPGKLNPALLGLLAIVALLVPIAVFILLFKKWKNSGRDEKGRGTIVAEYEPPNSLTPIAVGTLTDTRVDTKDLSSEIIYLATQGYLKIKRIEKGKIFKKDDYELSKIKDSSSLTNEFDRKLQDSLFSSGATVKMSDLKGAFYQDVPKIKKAVYEILTSGGYFKANPSKIKMTYLAIGIAVGFVGMFAGVGLAIVGGYFFIPSFVLTSFIIIVFGFIMPARTKEGILAKEHIEGLKLYMNVAEKDRIKFHNAPKKDPKKFEELLPYAMVLGVERQWAKQFEGIYKGKPDWYDDPSGRVFMPIVFADSMNNFASTSNSYLYTAPTSSGGSGFSSGGGFSGGGFGGGGGGSW